MELMIGKADLEWGCILFFFLFCMFDWYYFAPWWAWLLSQLFDWNEGVANVWLIYKKRETIQSQTVRGHLKQCNVTMQKCEIKKWFLKNIPLSDSWGICSNPEAGSHSQWRAKQLPTNCHVGRKSKLLDSRVPKWARICVSTNWVPKDIQKSSWGAACLHQVDVGPEQRRCRW